MRRILYPRPGLPYFAGAPLMIAHRGGALLAPENTMAAFRNAVDAWGVDMLEMDVRATADGRIVVIHDPTVDRTTSGTGAVESLSWEQIREMDAGYHFRDLQGDFSLRGKGVAIPLLDEVLESFPGMRMNIDAKSTAAAPGLVETIRRHNARDRVLMASVEEAQRGVRHGYDGPCGASRRQIRTFFLTHRLPLAHLYTPRADALQVPDYWEGRQVVTPGFIEAAHVRNIPVHVWTIDEPDAMRRLLGWGVDGIQSDRLDVLSSVLTEMVGRPPPPFRSGRPLLPPPEAAPDPS